MIFGFVFISIDPRITYYAVVCVAFPAPMFTIVWCYWRIHGIMRDSKRRLNDMRSSSLMYINKIANNHGMVEISSSFDQQKSEMLCATSTIRAQNKTSNPGKIAVNEASNNSKSATCLLELTENNQSDTVVNTSSSPEEHDKEIKDAWSIVPKSKEITICSKDSLDKTSWFLREAGGKATDRNESSDIVIQLSPIEECRQGVEARIIQPRTVPSDNITRDSETQIEKQSKCPPDAITNLSEPCGQRDFSPFVEESSPIDEYKLKVDTVANQNQTIASNKMLTIVEYINNMERNYYFAKTVTVLLLAYVICWTPFVTVSLIRVFKIQNGAPISVHTGIIQWALLFGYMNSAVNPFIYYLRQQKIRKGTIALLRKCFSQNR